jgi:hypothetical protein
MAKGKEKTYVITAAQARQNPYSANMYGMDVSKGAPNIPLIKNIEKYVASCDAELQIHSIVGANCNEIELHPFFDERDDVYVEADSKKRNLQNRVKERAKRNKWEKKVASWESNEIKKVERERVKKLKEKYGSKEWKEHRDELESFETINVQPDDCPYSMPMHYFWKDIPNTDWSLIGKRLNSNVSTVNIPIRPQNKMPLSGKEFLTKDFGGNSVVIGSPKRMMIPVAKGSSNEYPHLLITTGACTHPNYNFGDLGYIARKEHRYGFVVIDLIDDKIFLPRIVPAHKNGTFIDLGIKYSRGENARRAGVSALDIGDSHFVEINPKIDKVNMEMMEYLRPESTFLNDAFAALSVNVHDKTDKVRLARLHVSGLKNLEKELALTGEYIAKKGKLASRWGGDVYIKWSNHDDMLYRWLSTDSYINDNENRLTAFKILAQDISRENCFEKAVKLFYDIPDNVIFLEPGQDVFKQGYLMSMHGHQGSNGAKGSIRAIEKIAKKASIGHGHAPIVWKDSLSTGTSTMVPLDYQKGYFSSSMAGNNLIYETGLAQSVPIVKSMWAPGRVLDFLKKN